MKAILIIITLLFSFNAMATYIEYSELVKRDNLYYEKFADDHWSLYSWITNTDSLQTLIQTELGADWNSDVNIIATHHLDIIYDDKM